MPPLIAATLFGFGILGLFYLDRERKRRPSSALWIAVAWLAIGSSRMVSQWFVAPHVAGSPDIYLDGNPTDRLILSILLVLGLVVIARRGRSSLALLRANLPVVLFFGFCLLSVLWSDFPLVAFKRWTKALGNLTMVMLVLTDKNALVAVKQLFARVSFLLIPLSVLFIKYYPGLGRGYNEYTWTTFYCGVATDKNGLGTICLVFGLASFWRLVEAFRDKLLPGRMQVLLAHAAVLGMNIWLLMMAHSSTSQECFLLGCFIILTTTISRRTLVVHAITTVLACAAVLAFTFHDAYADMAAALGRDASLTGRTEIWEDVFRLHVNPWVGVGYESFWLGPRLDYFWKKYPFHPNEAHNGYIEIYLTIGLLGESLLVAQFVSGYRKAIRALRRKSAMASLQLAFIAVALLYNMTEAAFKVMHPVWIAFLFSAVTIPIATATRKTSHSVHRLTPVDETGLSMSRAGQAITSDVLPRGVH
jgi:exopolysaccharide production protein ExoQ